jgi:phosphoenolpyruvate-protein kinase (PTS system EI component)
MAFALLGLGLRTLSVAPPQVSRVKRIVRGVSVAVAQEAARAAMTAATAESAETHLRARLRAAFGEADLSALGLPAAVTAEIS